MRLKALLPEVQVKQGIRELEPFGGKPSQYRGKHLLFKQVDILDTRQYTLDIRFYHTSQRTFT